MNTEAMKSVLYKIFKAIEEVLDKELDKEEVSSQVALSVVKIFRFSSSGIINKIVADGRAYVENTVEERVQRLIEMFSSGISSLVSLVLGVFIICVGSVFAAVAFSFWLSSLVGSNALGFLLGGLVWVLITWIPLRIFLNKNRIKQLLTKEIKKATA